MQTSHGAGPGGVNGERSESLDVELDVLHVPDCPNLASMLDRLQGVTDRQVTTREIATPEEAVAYGMAGSPTLLVDGVDPFASGRADEYGVSCRIYRDEQGRMVPVPSVAQIRNAVGAGRRTATGASRTGESARRIGPWGTAARLVVGGFMVGSVVQGSIAGDEGFQPAAWLLGLVGLPGLFLVWQAWQTRGRSERFVALTGPLGHCVTLLAFVVLYATTWYAPPIDFVSDAALLFFGSSMLLAALRGYAGCEVLVISNWLLGRDDQLGCAVFDPIDSLEHARDKTTTDADSSRAPTS